MNLDFFEEINDPYMKTNPGKSFFLSGVLLGMISIEERSENEIGPILKALNFGKLSRREIKTKLSNVPIFLKREECSNSGRLSSLLAKIGEYFFNSEGEEPGVEGNFAFTIGFVSCWEYYKKIFPKDDGQESKEKEELFSEEDIQEEDEEDV